MPPAAALFWAVVSGVAEAAAFAPWDLWWCSLLALAPLLQAACIAGRAGSKKAFGAGYLQGIVFFGILLWWIAPTISRYGQIPIAAAWLVLFCLVLYLALYPGIWAWAAARIVPRGSEGGRFDQALTILALAALWALLEWVRGWMLTGFPWGALGYGLASKPVLIRSASIWGLWGVTFAAAMSSCAAFMVMRGKKGVLSGGLALAGSLLLLAMPGGGGLNGNINADGQAGEPLCACAVQGAFDQWEKWAPEMRQKTVKRYEVLTRRAAAECRSGDGSAPSLMVWPETAMPFYFQERSQLRQTVEALAGQLGIALLTGSPAYVKGPAGVSYLNSAWLVSPEAEVSSYSKRHLVPFGEYLPFGAITAWTRSFLPTAGDFVEGRSPEPLEAGPIKVGVLICFESIFPALARQEVEKGANILAVITNDAWFGRTAAPYQHAAVAAFRAVENGRFVVRAANTGVSQITAPDGRVLASSRLFQPEYVCGMVELHQDLTLYTRYGDTWFIGLLSVIIVTAYLRFRVRSARGQNRG